jgi:membrane protein implicated in regulation of membrane protease activity
MHANPRSADVCSQCGSRELSTPQPKVPISWRLLECLARAFFAVIFGILIFIFGIALVEAVLESPQLQTGMILLAILLGTLWWLWSHLPEWFRKLVRRSLERRRNREGR